MSRVRVLVACALFLAPALGVGAQAPAPGDSDRYALRRAAMSMSGLPGLVNIPTAASMPSGMVDLALTNAQNPASFLLHGTQRNAFIAIGFLPGVTLGLRGTVAVDPGNLSAVRDLSDNVQVQLLTESARRPAVAVGAFDAFGAADPYFRTAYAVATKSLANRYRLTLGYGTGPHLIKGVFGGAELHLTPWAAALGEFDGHDFNAGLRLLPLPSLADRAGLQPRVDVAWRQGAGVAASVGLRTSLGGRRDHGRDASRRQAPEASPSTTRQPAPVATAPPAPAPRARVVRPMNGTGADAMQAALVAEGFENVRVGMDRRGAEPTLVVEYENRRYNRDELDAVGVVMAAATRYAPDGTARLRLTIRRVDVPVITLECDLAAVSALVDGTLAVDAFASKLEISYSFRDDTGRRNRPAAAPSRWKLDLFARPRIETAVLTDLGVFDSRTSLLADGWMQLGRGVTLNARRTVAVTQSRDFPSWVEDPNSDRLLLHAAMWVPGVARSTAFNALTQLSVGRFGHNEVGIADEVDVSLAGGLLSLGATVGALGRSAQQLDHTIALGVARLRYAPLDLTASFTAGRFRNGDNGMLAELSRMFGNTEMGFFLRSTDLASAAGVRVALPLTTARDLPPMRIRPRLPDVHQQQLQAAVFAAPPYNVIRKDVARQLETDHEIARAYRTRDRLQAVTIREHVDVIRDRARAWLRSADGR